MYFQHQKKLNQLADPVSSLVLERTVVSFYMVNSIITGRGELTHIKNQNWFS